MSLNANKLANNEIIKTQQTGATSAQTAQVNSSSTSTPIDFSSKTEKVFSEIVEFINSDEFKSLPPERQKQMLFERFPALKTMTDEQIKQYIITAKQTVENQKKKQTEAAQIVENTQDSSKQSDLEKLANEYLKNQKSDIDTIDKLISELLSKAKNNKLTAEERKILDTYNKITQSKTDELNAQQKSNDAKSKITDSSSLLSEEQINKLHDPNTTDEQKLIIYADAFLTKNDKEYAKLQSKEEKMKYIDTKLCDIVPEWKNLTSEQKDKYIKSGVQEIITTIKALHEAGMSLTDLKQIPANEKNNIIQKYKIDHNLPISEIENAEKAIIDELQGGDYNKEIRYKDIEQVLLQKEKDGTLTKTEKQLLEKYRLMQKISAGIEKEHVYVGKSLSEKIENDQYNNIEEYLDDKLKPDMKLPEIEKVINGADNEQLIIISNKLESLGYSQEQIRNILDKCKVQIVDNASEALVEGKNIGAINAGTELLAENDTEAAQIYAIEQSHYIKDSTVLAKVGENTIQHQELIQPFAQGINTYKTDKEAVKLSVILASSANVADGNKALFSKSIVETAPTAKRQLILGQELSKINNPAVTEGLAAASNSVDASVRSQYNSHIETAMKNYPPEQQAAIKSALETGTISQQTLSRTELPTQQLSADNQTLPKGNMQQTLNSQQDIKGAQTGYRAESVASAKSTAQTTNTKNTDSSTPTAPRAQMSEQETIELAQKAQALMDKIENFQKEQSQSIKNWEEVQAAKSNASTTEALSDETVTTEEYSEEIAQYTDLVLDESEKEVLKKVLTEMFTSNSISRAFEELGKKFGENTQMKFLEVFASKGSPSDIRAFAENFKSNPQIILTLFQFSQDQSLLRYLDNADILNLYYTGKITNIDAIKERYEVISKIIEDGMKNGQNHQELGNLITYLPADFQGALLKTYPDLAENVPGTDEWFKKSLSNEKKTNNIQVTDYETSIENKQDDNLFANNKAANNETAINSTRVPNYKYDKYKKRNGYMYLA